MRITKRAVWYGLTGVIALLFLGLLWWFYFLGAKEAAITTADAARGYGTAAPAPSNSIGSTYDNIISGLSSFIGGNDAASDAPDTRSSLWHVTKTPVAGFAFESSMPKLLFAERSTGYIVEADLAAGTLTRITNKLAPKTYEAAFGAEGDVILRSLDEVGLVESFAATITGFSARGTATTSGMELRGNDLVRGVVALVPFPKTREVVYIVRNPGGGSSITRSSWDGSKRIVLLSSPLAGWRLSATGDGRLFLVQTAEDDVAGSAYELKGGALDPVVQGVLGLTFLPRTGEAASLIGESRDGALALSAYLADGRTIVLPVRTTANKCVWAPTPSAAGAGKDRKPADPLVAYCAVPQTISSRTFLGDSYRGALHTADTWWRVDANTGAVEPLALTGSTNEPLDVENPAIDGGGGTIAFMNARDQSLWVLRLPRAATSTAP